MAQTLQVMVDRVRAEAKVKGSDTLVGFIIYIINEVLQEYTARRRFDQLRVVSHPIARTADGTFPLPANLQALQRDYIYFSEDGDYEDNSYGLLYAGDFRGNSAGLPNRIQRVGNNLLVYPYGDLTADSRIYINYWRKPTELLLPSDVLEIEELQATVLKESIARVSRHSDSDVFTAYVRDAARSYAASFGVDAQRPR